MFLKKNLADQPSVVEAVVAGIAEHVFGSASDGLLAVWPLAKSVVKSTLIEVATDRSLTGVHGRLELRGGGVLALVVDLGTVLQIRNSRNWRTRIASVCGFLDAMSQQEGDAKLAQTSKKLAVSPVVIDWPEVFAALKHLPAGDRYERAHNLAGELARDVLLGYWGLEVLCSEFDAIKSEVQNRVKQISLSIGGSGGTYRVEMKGTTLRVVFPLEETRKWNKSNKQGCRERVEALLGLRKQVEAEAVAEQERQHVAPAAAALGKKVAVGWAAVLASPDYLAERDYVAYLRYVGAFVPKLLLGYGDQRPEGLPWMLATNAQAKEFFATITALEVEIDGECKAQPAQERFVNARIRCAKKAPSTLVFAVRRDWMETPNKLNGNETTDSYQLHHGAGTNAGAVLAPAVFAAEEANHLEVSRKRIRSSSF